MRGENHHGLPPERLEKRLTFKDVFWSAPISILEARGSILEAPRLDFGEALLILGEGVLRPKNGVK